jgi:hypothetical protein
MYTSGDIALIGDKQFSYIREKKDGITKYLKKKCFPQAGSRTMISIRGPGKKFQKTV